MFIRWVVKLLAVVGLVGLAWRYRTAPQEQLLQDLIFELIVFLVVLILYLGLFLGWTRPILVANRGRTETVRAVVGFVLRKEARSLREQKVSDADILKGNQFKPEEVWTPASLLAARVAMAVLWMAFLVIGTLLLATSVSLLFPPRAV